MKISARVLFFVVFIFSFFVFFSQKGYAQNQITAAVNESSNNYTSNLNPDVPRDQHSYVQSTTIEIMASMVCQLSGIDMLRKDQKCLGVDPSTGKLGFVDNGGGAVGLMSNLIAATFNPPISTSQYVSYMANNFGIGQKTYAAEPSASECAGANQGVGFCGIKPILEVWVAMRNIAYLLFVIIFVLIGLAIMFRVHIDPRTIMTIENQVPRIIMGIILVTFSFALAGLLIDVMYVSIYLVGGVLTNIPGHEIRNYGVIATSPTPFDAINRLWPGDPNDDFGTGIGGGFSHLALQGSDTMRNLVMGALNGSPTGDGTISNFEPGLLDFVGGLFSALVGLIIGIASALIIFLALIYTAIRLWIILITAYINILLDIVFAPFWFLIGLFPGSSLGVGAWFKDMLANLAVFPTAMSMLVLGKVFSDVASKPNSVTSGQLFVPPLAGGGIGGQGEIFAGVVALGFLFMTPHVLNLTRGVLKAPNINYGPVFQTPGAALSTITGTAKEIGAMRVASQEYVPGAGGAWEQRGLRGAFRTRTFR